MPVLKAIRNLCFLVFLIAPLTMACADKAAQLRPMPVYLERTEDGDGSLSFIKSEGDSAAPFFYAIQSMYWPNGLIPIFQEKKKATGHRLLRSLTHAKENFKEALFFALPPADEAYTERISGRWACDARHADGTIDFLHWEMSLHGEVIVGRFDQDSDYRFAWLNEGQFKYPKLEIKVSYMDAKYELKGNLEAESIQGTWRHLEDADSGTWIAKPAFQPSLPFQDYTLTELYASKEEETGRQILSLHLPKTDNDSVLCRVWIPRSPSSGSPPQQSVDQ